MRRSGDLASFDLPSKECSALKQAHLVRHSYTNGKVLANGQSTYSEQNNQPSL